MRLIDADALIEDLKGSLFYADSIPFVEDAPTAYDVGRIVEEIKKESAWYNGFLMIHTEEALDIVIKGGVE